MDYEISDPNINGQTLTGYERLYQLQVRNLKSYTMFLTDPQGKILTWNAGVRELLGYSEEEWVGQHCSTRRRSYVLLHNTGTR